MSSRSADSFHPRSDSALLRSFRGDVRVPTALHPLEKALLVVAGALLCFMPWALGAMQIWSQYTSLGLAALAFAIAIVNRSYRGDLAPQGDFKLIMWPKLVRFPLFWLGLLLLGYILTQALNTAWVYMKGPGSWWLDPLPSVSWLPAGMDTPFKDMNPWRVLVIYGAAWLLACALWTGITRRAAAQKLLTVIVVNGTLLATVGILQRVTNAAHILWGLKGVNTAGGFFGTIIYKNHAGAYLNLVLMICVGLLYWHFSRAERRLERASPAPVFAFCSVLLGLGVLLTFSRAGTLLMLLFVVIAFAAFLTRCIHAGEEGRSPWVLVLLAGVFALFIGLGAYFLNAEKALDRVGKLMTGGQTDHSVTTRILARAATWEMARDTLVTGWGAGSFRHYFPVYQRHYPEIYDVPWHPQAKMRWEYAHNDYVQLLAELGLAGAGILLAMLACGARHLWRQRVWRQPHLLFILLALLVTTAHAWVDFQFHNPAILVLWCATAALAGRWAEFENRRG